MKLTLLVIGKTDRRYIDENIKAYEKRIKHYIKFEIVYLPDLKNRKNLSQNQQKQNEAKLIEDSVSSHSELCLFDEKGKIMNSREFASFLQKKMASGLKELILVIGGPYGFTDELKKKANTSISLSKMTFSHQMVRIICAEQIYRAFTIINNEPYHND